MTMAIMDDSAVAFVGVAAIAVADDDDDEEEEEEEEGEEEEEEQYGWWWIDWLRRVMAESVTAESLMTESVTISFMLKDITLNDWYHLPHCAGFLLS